MFYREWVSKINRRCGNMIKAELFAKVEKRHNPGWISVYSFSEPDALEILASGTSQGFARYIPAAEELVIDLDDGDSQLPALVGVLEALGLGFRVYSSGSKGFHVHIPHQLIEDFRLPYSHKNFVENLRVKADFSLYRPNSLVALPGRIHPKTGKRKTLVSEVAGTPLALNLVEQPPKPEGPVFSFDDDMPEFNRRVTGLYMLTKLAGKAPAEGDRHLAIWKTAKMLCEAGFSREAVEPLIMEINESWPNPKSLEGVEEALDGAYRQRSRKRGSSEESAKPGPSVAQQDKPSSQDSGLKSPSTTKTARSPKSQKSGTGAKAATN